MLVLTHSDELNRTYCDDARRKRERSPAQPHKDDPTIKEVSPCFKETRATVISTGSKSLTITSAVSRGDSLWFKNTRSHHTGGSSSEMHEESRKTEEDPSFDQVQGSRRDSYRVAGLIIGREELRCSEDIDGEKDGEATSRSPSNQEKEGPGFSEANSSQTITGVNSSPTITAWEAGWNVTNAIQVLHNTVRLIWL